MYVSFGTEEHEDGEEVFAARPQYDAFRYTLPEKNCPNEEDTLGTSRTHITEPPARTKEGLHCAAVVFLPFTLT
jgi:hypothetical protein